jgi:hypothetical protein
MYYLMFDHNNDLLCKIKHFRVPLDIPPGMANIWRMGNLPMQDITRVAHMLVWYNETSYRQRGRAPVERYDVSWVLTDEPNIVVILTQLNSDRSIQRRLPPQTVDLRLNLYYAPPVHTRMQNINPFKPKLQSKITLIG